MKFFRVLLHGKNFLFGSDEGNKKIGFLTTRWVKADNPENAELAAVDLVYNDPELKGSIQNEEHDPPVIYLYELNEVSWFEYLKQKPGSGYTFYSVIDEE